MADDEVYFDFSGGWATEVGQIVEFTCPRCGAVSHNRNDLREGYCGRCHTFTRDERPPSGQGWGTPGAYCIDCPDREACGQGAPCHEMKPQLFASMRECAQCGTTVLVKWSPEVGAYPAPASCAEHT